MKRALAVAAIICLGLCAFAAAAYTVLVAFYVLAIMSAPGLVVFAVSLVVTVGLIALMKRVASYAGIEGDRYSHRSA